MSPHEFTSTHFLLTAVYASWARHVSMLFISYALAFASMFHVFVIGHISLG